MKVFFSHIIKTLTSVLNSQLQSKFCLILKAVAHFFATTVYKKKFRQNFFKKLGPRVNLAHIYNVIKLIIFGCSVRIRMKTIVMADYF